MLNKLSTQIGLLFFLGIALVLGISHWIDFSRAAQKLPQRAATEALESTQLIASSISNDVLYRKTFPLWKHMSRIQLRFSDDAEIILRGFAVTDVQQLVLTHNDPIQHPIMKKMAIPSQAALWNDNFLQITQDILHPSDQRVIGHIVLNFDASSVQRELTELKQGIALSFIPAFFVALFLAIGIRFRVSTPLQQLTSLSARIGDGHLNIETFADKPTEIQHLAHAIQRADQTIETRTLELAHSDAQIARLASVVEQADEMIIVTDHDGIIEYVNPAFERISGFSAAEAIGQTSRLVKSGHHSDSYYTGMWKALKKGNTWHGDFTNQSKNGDLYEVTQTISPIANSKGAITGFSSVQRDVTQYRIMQKKLQHTDRVDSLGVLAGGIAHDFNNLLTAILGNAAMALKKLESTSPALKNLASIEHASHSAADLCKQMLAYSGKGMFVVKPIDLSELVEHMGKLIDVTLAKNVVLKYHLADQLPPIDADMAQMQQVILNLISNASEAIEGKSGVISITTGVMQANTEYLDGCVSPSQIEPGRYISMEVSDTGCGMDAETQKKIFDPFFTTKFTGRGLGMSAMLGIIKGHRGALRIYSELGSGTTIKVIFPLSAEQYAHTDQQVVASPAWKSTGTALIIDDEETVREVASVMLEEVGFNVITANDGLEGVEVFRQHQDKITVVLLDMTMPKMGGEACFSELKRIRSDVKVILSSGYNEQDVTNRFAGKGLAGFLQKPYAPDALIEKLQEILT